MKNKVGEYSFKGVDNLLVYGSRFEVEEPKGIILALHGMAEHRKRYGELAEKLNEAGYSFYIHDHRGHGDTALKNNLTLGHFADNNGWNKVIRDVEKHRELILNRNKKENNDIKDLPIFLFGHSMGSFVGRDYIMRNPEDFSGAIFSGTGYVKNTELFLLKFFIGLEKLIRGKKKKSTIVENIVFSSNNKEFEPTQTPHDWLTRNSDVAHKYYNDERCGFSCTVQFYNDFYQGMKKIADKENYKNLPENYPLIFLSGDKDPVGGEDIVKVAYEYKDVGLKDVEYKLYENGRHEMINELNKEEFFKDVKEWLKKHTS